MTLFRRYSALPVAASLLLAGSFSYCSRNHGDVSVQASAIDMENPADSPSELGDTDSPEEQDGKSSKRQNSSSARGSSPLKSIRRSVDFMNGMYGPNCDEKQGSFSVAINGYAGTMPNPSLAVTKEDEDCTLEISSFSAGGAIYIANHALTVDDDFKGEPTAFVGPQGDTIFINAKLSDAHFKTRVLIQVVHSRQNEHARRDHIPNHRIQVSTLPTEDELAPKYLGNPLGLVVFVDQSGMITGSIGKVHLLTLEQTGEDYMVFSEEPKASLEELQAAFTNPVAIPSPAKRFFVPQTSLSLVGKVIPSEGLKRYIVIRHTDQEGPHFQKIILTIFPSKR